ncbi:TIGR01621 family pseudouridine synthase [Alteromonas facilis]|uniref:TIGR01621 family pseudouridine synthase n=1 Tax=Alteromonas facilis TaxID=2048004 RepID=UPI000C28D0C5|nr:TIGR01621 family pseudouridine synthase [Alteromonas facilis]
MLNIIFEHESFLIISKPVGMCMHYQDGELCIGQSLVELGVQEHYLVHRLDTETSGLMVVAKNKQAAAYLSDAFAKRQVQKYYIALSNKKPSKKQGHIIGDMKNLRRGNYALLRSRENPAYTQFFSYALTAANISGLRLFVLKPLTGKTHQLRVAMSSIGSPIVGDERYAKTPADRMYLHAARLDFEYEGVQHSFVDTAPTGSYFEAPWFHNMLDQVGDLKQLAWPLPLSIAS